ncbi:hypothetical protein [Maricaulis sp.]|uniref:hypothetical protein n=1 Tax=Maricaulis sp. TaxID=1486257 RepID=UPI0025C68B86|nr:hypothetical protein [Maricaulis sp.]
MSHLTSQAVCAAIIALWGLISLVLVLGVYADLPILDHYLFRQTQVATVAREIARGGPWLDYLMPLFGPPWSAPMEFPLYQIVTAKLSNASGLPLELSGRLVSVFSGIAVLLATWRAAVLLSFDKVQQVVLVALLAASPMYFFWSHTVMIEVFSLALALGMGLCALEFTQRDRLWPLGLGIVFAILATLAKSTTFAVFACAVFALFALQYLRFAWENRGQPGALVERGLQWLTYGLALLGPALLITFVWVDYSDSLKAAHPLTEFLTSERLHDWNYGSNVERGQSASYILLPFRGDHPSILHQAIGSFWWLAILLALPGLALEVRRRGWLMLGLLVSFVSGFLIFSNLYEHHYYYWIANVIFLFGVLALGISRGVEVMISLLSGKTRLPEIVVTRAVPTLFAAILVTGALWTWQSFFFQRSLAGWPAGERIGASIADRSEADEIIYVFGVGWNPALQYLSDRRFVMGYQRREALAYAANIGPAPALLLICSGERERADEILSSQAFEGAGFEQVDSVGFCNFYAPTEP